jgi:AbrB family looped-hinge helix DNA binding protein
MKISEKGQITIPKNFRDKFGMQKDMEIELKPFKNGLLISLKKNLKKHPIDEIFGILGKKSDTDSYLDEVRGK